MTTAQDLLMVEVDEDPAALAARLAGDGLTVRLAERGLLIELSDEDTYDVIRDAVADLDLSLHRLERRRHQVADLFRDNTKEESRAG
jgi:ABC-2 type transport system ATP-binding protein